MEDQVNYDVLARFWPLRPYGYPGWWQYVELGGEWAVQP
jgi:hypothetical protein